MIYGDNPENKTPDSSAITQSGNLYVYCGNNPVMGYDPTGELVLSAIVVGAAIGGILGAVNSTISQLSEHNGDWSEVNLGKVTFDGAIGALGGALASSGISKVVSVIAGGVIGAVSSIASDCLFNENVKTEDGYDWGQISFNSLKNAAIGMFSGFISGAGADYIGEGQQITKFINSKHILNKTIANNTQRAIANQTSVMYHHAKQLMVSGMKYLASNVFNLVASQTF